MIRFLKLYGVPILAIVVAVHQLTHRTLGLSSWKGGGFGMYAEFHPVYNKLLIFSEKPIERPNTQASLKLNELMFNARLYPNERSAERIKEECNVIYGVNEYRIEVWKPRFNPDSCRFFLLKEDEF